MSAGLRKPRNAYNKFLTHLQTKMELHGTSFGMGEDAPKTASDHLSQIFLSVDGGPRLEMLKFEHNVTFASVDLTKVAKLRPKLMKRLLNDVCRLLSENEIKPIYPITTYPISQVEAGFRALQAGKNMGKSVVVSNAEDQVKVRSTSATNTSFITGSTNPTFKGRDT